MQASKKLLIPLLLSLATLSGAPVASLASDSVSGSSPVTRASADSKITLQPGEVRSSLTSLFCKESTAVIFYYRPGMSPTPGTLTSRRYILIQTDEKGREIHRLGPLLDDGILGDQVAHDGIYSRKFQLNLKIPGPVYYTVSDEGLPSQVATPASNQAKIDIIQHPAFPTLLKQIWDRIASHQAQ